MKQSFGKSGKSDKTQPLTLSFKVSLTLGKRPEFGVFPIERLGLVLRIGTTPEHGTEEQIIGSK
jgi:hypothetical protein